MGQDKIIVRGARQHNLKNITVELPRDKLIVITGLSGSGKSSLAFDTIYAEGQRRYVESLSSYARQFLGQMDKPDVDDIIGLSPAVSIDQKSGTRNPRSTVGTVTEIYDYLRLMFARVGHPHCPQCGREIAQQTVEQMVDAIMGLPESSRIQVLAPLVRGKKGQYRKLIEDVAKEGFGTREGRWRGARGYRGHRTRPLQAAHHRDRNRQADRQGRHPKTAHRLGRDRPQKGKRRAGGPRGRPGRNALFRELRMHRVRDQHGGNRPQELLVQ